MEGRRQRVRTILEAIVHEIRVERITFMAGSIAYNAFVSLLPLLFLLLAVVSAIGDQQLESGLISVVRATVTPGAGEVLVNELRSTSTEASIFGLVVLVWGMLRIFRSLDAAFSDIYETEARNTFGNQIADGLTVFVSMAGVILVAVLVESRVTFGTTSTLGWLAHRLVLLAFIALALYPMYYLFPDEPDMHPLEAAPGVLFTATALVCFESLFQLYVAYSSDAAQNSVLAGILVFMTWLYLSGLVVLVGGAINAVLSNRSEDVNIRPVFGGVPPVPAPADGLPPQHEDPAGALEALQHRLPTASDVTVVVDGESISLPVPERVETDDDSSRLPFVNDTVGISLRWRRGDGDVDE
ncbi:YhjD/YihY/BrkB family envelope integrity protein [Natronobeatus ordinarius]|uniref:YhjD/YihY/BrkB family envelope integrity protein n=1 Tax=Natronobeatus ordinarius TaxID=2963433 RepID=UPI0020CCE293|nr:YhjD/YihY/BrkB family envelope integrity protein [Natronobeatus ordinarius]